MDGTPHRTSPQVLADGTPSLTDGTIGGVLTGLVSAKNQLKVTLATGAEGVEYNFAENSPADPFGYVYVDRNRNGVRDTGEPGIQGVSVSVSGIAFAGTALQHVLAAADVPGGLTAVTDASGLWQFPVIPPGVYSLVESQPAGYGDGLEQNADPSPPATVVVGWTDQTVNIRGRTTVDDPTSPPPVTFDSGFLAASSNIGRHHRDLFTFVPEVTAQLGYWLTPQLQFSCGYNFLYWNNVVRPGQHINPNLDVSQVPPGTAAGPVQPLFGFAGTGFWAQGIQLGLDYRF